MTTTARVSVIIIFLNAERFIEEAIESVLGQTYSNWELLLVDDGSTDASTGIALSYAERDSRRIQVLEHPGHTNQGMSASRNLGVRHSRGQYIAFLDADDVWLPHKLTEQVDILSHHPGVEMLYGNTEYWFDWTGSPHDRQRNYVPNLGLQPNRVYAAPRLLPLFLSGQATVPCTCSVMVTRSALERVGGGEDSFRSMYEDQVLYAKLCLQVDTFVSDRCWDKYRQHEASACSTSERAGNDSAARLRFLNWLEQYLVAQGRREPELWRGLRAAQWFQKHPRWHRSMRRFNRLQQRWNSGIRSLLHRLD